MTEPRPRAFNPTADSRKQRQNAKTTDPFSGAADMLMAAVCKGPRCRAVRDLQDSSEIEAADHLLREAIDRRSRSIMVSTECQGPCHQACVVTVGQVRTKGHRMLWTDRPVLLGLTESLTRTADLATWFSTTAPDLTTLPKSLGSQRSV